MTEPEKPVFKPPFVVEISPKVRGRYGYKDGRVELEVDLPMPLSAVMKRFKQRFTPEEAKLVWEALGKAVLWNSIPDYQRQRDGAD